MNNIKSSLSRRKAAALIVTYMILAVTSIYAAAFLNRATYHYSSVLAAKHNIQAFNLAESGLNKTISWLRVQPSPPTGNSTNPWGGTQNLGAGSYNVTITDLGTPSGNLGLRRYKVTSTGTVEGINRVVTNYIETDNYARYIWFTDRETYNNNNVWFWRLDYLNGPTHTNSHFNIYGNPVFAGEVRSVDDYIRFYNNGNPTNLSQTQNAPHDLPDFQQGITFGAEKTTMPSQALNLRTASTIAGGLRLQGNTTIVLNADGTMNVTNSQKGWTNQNMALPANGALFVDNDGSNKASLTISGQLNGRLTVGAAKDVIIPANLTYANDPRTNPASTDTLGLIAERNVVIDDSGPTDLEINASIMALETSFVLENYASVAAKGTLTVYGGIIQDQRGPVGTFNGATGQKVSGYSKNYAYDERLLTSPPPYYPTTGDYITLAWQED